MLGLVIRYWLESERQDVWIAFSTGEERHVRQADGRGDAMWFSMIGSGLVVWRRRFLVLSFVALSAIFPKSGKRSASVSRNVVKYWA